MDIRKNHDLRLRTYDHLIKLKKQGISRKKIIDLTYDYLLTKNWDLFSNISFFQIGAFAFICSTTSLDAS